MQRERHEVRFSCSLFLIRFVLNNCLMLDGTNEQLYAAREKVSNYSAKNRYDALYNFKFVLSKAGLETAAFKSVSLLAFLALSLPSPGRAEEEINKISPHLTPKIPPLVKRRFIVYRLFYY